MKHKLLEERIPDLQCVELPPGITTEEVRFALNTIQGRGPQEAYRLAIGDARAAEKSNNQLSKHANKVKNRSVVQKYMAALVAELERVAIANALDIQMFLSAVIFTPVGEIDENHPLCQKMTTTTTINKDGTETVRKVVEMPSKKDCVQLLNRMKGLDAPVRIDVNHRHGVMVVPMASNVEDWEKLAATSQQVLMADAVDID